MKRINPEKRYMKLEEISKRNNLSSSEKKSVKAVLDFYRERKPDIVFTSLSDIIIAYIEKGMPLPIGVEIKEGRLMIWGK